MKHTPGPWAIMTQNLRVSPCDPRCPDMWEVPIQAGNVLAMVYGSRISGETSKQECLANARLIAAAPTLKEAMEEVDVGLHYYMREFGDIGGRLGDLRKIIYDALAKLNP